MDDERRQALLGTKLAALSRPHLTAPETARSVAFPLGAGLVAGDDAWVLVEGDADRALGPAMAWARRLGARLHLVAEQDAGDLARRAGCFAEPPTVWSVRATSLVAAAPAPPPADPPLDQRVAAFADVLARAGCDPVVEHGRLIGEVSGLEVARVEVDGGEPRLEVGVGRFDREANALLAGASLPGEAAGGRQTPSANLARVVDLVRLHRRPGAAPHPLNRLAASRWLRSRLLAAPALVGADHLVPVAAVVAAPDLRTPWPAPASGIDTEGRPLVVVCSVGIDLDLVPAAADVRLADGRDARLVLAVPPRDDHPVTRALAALLRDPADVVTVATERP